MAERHGSAARVHEYNRKLGRHVTHAEGLGWWQLRALRRLYAKIKANGHNRPLNEWCDDTRDESNAARTARWGVYGLLCLFRQLKTMGIQPFVDGAVGPEDTRPVVPLDWSKLPPELAYLAGPAEKYGAFQFDDPIVEFLQERMTGSERAELSALSPRSRDDFEAINRWLDEFPMTKHREAALVYFTGHLMGWGEELGLLGPEAS